jgi:hypothetical protein
LQWWGLALRGDGEAADRVLRIELAMMKLDGLDRPARTRQPFLPPGTAIGNVVIYVPDDGRNPPAEADNGTH